MARPSGAETREVRRPPHPSCCVKTRRSAAAAADSVDLPGWEAELEEMLARIDGWFWQVRPRERAHAYVRGPRPSPALAALMLWGRFYPGSGRRCAKR